MYEKITWTHPVKRRFKTRLSLAGVVLQQELSGVQVQETIVTGATHQEYADAMTEKAGSDFVEGLEASASPIFRHGYEAFAVTVTGTRRVVAGGIDPAQDGSYLYTPANASIP